MNSLVTKSNNSQRSPENLTENIDVQQVDDNSAATSSAVGSEEVSSKQDGLESLNEGAHRKEFYDEKTIGTEYQKVIIKDYPMATNEQKLKVPYIERFNGNLSV